ncbi:acyltransferase [Amycolatopsis acidicola]|uniref:Acyltransferase n=1 Tax=Amycolatopsis acidicola TaxID=2596893 RepID=A0A5N0V1F0_9PSEU|nr:acyltransferase [Amycolatopsis acidicola]KAA9157922.1 acyltransferase [Amycolatopsis acidicola]
MTTDLAAAPVRPREGRLRNIDLMRVTVFLAVISAHVVTNTLDLAGIGVAGWGMLMHFTRYAFVFISGFVLFHGYRGRKLTPATFWRKRFSTVVVPYVLWTCVYFGLDSSLVPWPSFGLWLETLGQRVSWGNEWYHLYFLHLTIQLSLLFPLLRRLVRRSEGRHGLLLAAAGAIQAGYMWMISEVPAPAGPLGEIWPHTDMMLPLYVFFFVAGAVAAEHREALDAWITGHRWVVVAIGVGTLLFTGGVFVLRAPDYAWAAAAPTYPAVLPWAIGATLLVYAASLAWSRRRPADGFSARLVAAGAHRAFGVFAVHPLVLWVLEVTLVPWLGREVPDAPARTAIVFLLTVAGALAVVEVLLHTPLSKYLLARPHEPLPASRVGPSRLRVGRRG